MQTKKMLLMMLTQLTVILLTNVAQIKSSTVEPRSFSSEAYTTEEGKHYYTEDDLPAKEQEKQEAQEDPRTARQQQEHDGTGNGRHEILHDHHWNYHEDYGPERWSSMYKDCAGIGGHQSPINIEPRTTKLNELLSEISLLVHRVSGDNITIRNNGHTVNLAFDHSSVRLDGGTYDHTYRVAGVHFHWDSDDLKGSEHRISGKQFPLEMHVVCYNEDDHDSVPEATSSRDGIAVLAVLFTVSKDDNKYLDPIISRLEDVRVPDKSASLEYFDLEKLLPLNRKNYFRYRGSLTTPPCSENVVWTVFETTQTISSTQLAEFRTLYETVLSNGTGDPLLHNWRPVQPISKRIVYRSFPADAVISQLSRSAPHDSSDAHQSDDAASSVVWNSFYQQSILLVGWITFCLTTTIL